MARSSSTAARAAVAVVAAAALTLGPGVGLSAPATAVATLTAGGTVQAPEQLALSFSQPGRLVSVDVQPGQHVVRGQTLARLDTSSAALALRVARANLAAARAQLAQLRHGVSHAERVQLRIAMRQASAAVGGAAQTLADTRDAAAQDATRLQAAVTQATAQLTSDQAKQVRDETALATDDSAATAALAQLGGDRAKVAADQAKLLADEKREADDQAASVPTAGDAKAILDDQAALSTDQTAVDADSAALADDRGAAANDRQTLDADADRIVADQNALADAQDALGVGAVSERQSLHGAQSALATAGLAADSTRAANAAQMQPARGGTLATARAQVDVAAAAVATAEQALAETRLVAPFSGTIASIDAVAGQLAGSNPVLTLVDLGRLTVTATFNAAESVLVTAGQTATVLVGALGESAVNGRVTAVDPLPAQGSPSGYRTTIALATAPPGLRPGMAAQVRVRVR
jgi:multidrug efflux pump subunit AcrA (membrane-fusion protein)